MRLAHGLVFLVFVGCIPEKVRSALPPRPASSSPTSTDSVGAKPRHPEHPWQALLSRTVAVTESPIVSAHLGRAHRAELRVNPEARAAYLALVADTEFPLGTLLIEQLQDAVSGQRGPLFTLERTATGWRFARIESDGTQASPSSVDFCAGCHSQATAPPVFGLPRPPATAPSTPPSARN